MSGLKEGAAVHIVERAATAADTKSGLYFGHYRNLSGTIFKLYGSGEDGQAAIDVDLESLPADVAQRHLETRDLMFNSLPVEARRQSAPGTASPFRLRYIVLVGTRDLKHHAVTLDKQLTTVS